MLEMMFEIKMLVIGFSPKQKGSIFIPAFLLIYASCIFQFASSAAANEGLLFISDRRLTDISFSAGHPGGQRHCSLKAHVVGGNHYVGEQPYRDVRSWAMCIPFGQTNPNEGHLCKVTVDALAITSQGGSVDALREKWSSSSSASSSPSRRGPQEGRRRGGGGGLHQQQQQSQQGSSTQYGWRGRVRVQCIAEGNGCVANTIRQKQRWDGPLLSMVLLLLVIVITSVSSTTSIFFRR